MSSTKKTVNECCQVHGEGHLHCIDTGWVKRKRLSFVRAWKCACGHLDWRRDNKLTIKRNVPLLSKLGLQ